MFRDIRKNKVFNRRALFISASQGVLTTILLARLSYLQIFKHKEFIVQSNFNSVKPLINPAPRGIISDRNNISLSENKQNYRLYLYLEDKENLAKLVDDLTNILNLNAKDKEILHYRINKGKKRTVISLIDSLSWDDVARVEVNSYRLPGISIESEFLRLYPYPNETAHFVGYVSLANEQEFDKNEKILYAHPSFRIGKTGLEKSFDEYLRGKYGVKYVEVNALERPIRTISIKDSKKGSPLRTTIDIDLQKFATNAVKDKAASIIVLDVKTGEILSYVSSPNFDGNNFVEGISKDYWDILNKDRDLPLNNRPISATYPPGSTFKLMTALAALESGISEKETHFCNGHFNLGKRRFHCWEEKGHQRLNMIEAIERSCNVYFYNIASKIGIDKIAQIAKRFGYGEKFDINLQPPRIGNVPTEKWKEEVLNQVWVGGDTLNCAIGQGFVLASPLQMAVATARIANGGVPISPFLIKSHKSETQFERLQSKKLVSQKHLDIILQGMENVVNKTTGTSHYRRISEKGFEMAGKTGTSQVISKRQDELSKSQKTHFTQNHAIFVGFAPISNPKYAISVVVEHGGGGSFAAAPIARDVLLQAQKLEII